MNKKDALQKIKTEISCTDYLDESPKAGKGMYICPFCGSGTGPNGSGALKYYPETNTFTCFSCRKSGDVLTLIEQAEQTDFNGALQIGAEKLGITIDETDPAAEFRDELDGAADQKPERAENEKDLTPFISKAAESIQYAEGYIHERGLSMETARRFMLGVEKVHVYGSEKNGQQYADQWTALIIPTSKYSYVMRNLDRKAAHGNRYRKQGKSHIFNLKGAKAETEKPVFIVEGEIDALSIIEAGGQAIALGSAENRNLLIDALKDWHPKTPLVIALDNDQPGRKGAAELKAALTEKGVTFYQYNPCGIAKDANEALVTNGDAFRAEIQKVNEDIAQAAADQERAEYLKDSAAAHLQEFQNGIQERANTPPISTGFTNLDTILDGGLYEGLYFVGAISSIGKTSFCLQMADQIAQSGQDVIIFSLEMARSELMAKSISRLTYTETLRTGQDSRDAKTTRGITDGSRYARYSMTEKALINTAIEQYGQYAKHIFIHEGMGDIGVKEIAETVEKHISITGNKPVIIVDYVQILAPADVRATDKQNTDKAVLELKRLSRDYKIPVIGISSFNRESYKAGSESKGVVTMADFKESGAIEYSADVLIGLQFQNAGKKEYKVSVEKKKDPMEIKLIILKNRNGSPYLECAYKFYKMFNYFQESADFPELDESSTTAAGKRR